jgi:hypothetical protein
MMNTYYESLRTEGLPFSETSEKYSPYQSEQFVQLLHEFRLKNKSSPMVQLADLFLWPICMGGYHRSNRTYARLMNDGKLIECHVREEDWAQLGTKYSCFENVKRKT